MSDNGYGKTIRGGFMVLLAIYAQNFCNGFSSRWIFLMRFHENVCGADLVEILCVRVLRNAAYLHSTYKKVN